MKKRKIELDPVPFDDEERDMIEAVEDALNSGELRNELTPERKVVHQYVEGRLIER